MATHRKEILGWSLRVDSTGEAGFEPENVNFGSNDLFQDYVLFLGSALASEPTVKHGVYGKFKVPKNYVGTAAIVIGWSATVTANEVVFDFDYRAVGGDNSESLDQATFQESVTVTDTAPTTARSKMEASVNLTSANLAVDDIVQFFFGRDGADGADDLAGRVYVFSVEFQYSDT